jgi:hypothetical protein
MDTTFLKRTGTLLLAGLFAAACGGSSTTNLTVPGTVSGKVTNASSAAVAGVAVTPSPAAVPAATTDSTGKYSLQLPPGSYTLSFTADNYEPATASVSVKAGAATAQDQQLAASTLVVTVSLPAGLKNGGPSGFNAAVSGITATAKLGDADVTSSSTITWAVKDYYGLTTAPGGATASPDTGPATGFNVADFETLRVAANDWLNTRYKTAGTAEEFEYIHAPERDQLLSLGVQQVRAMSFKVIATVTNGGRKSTGSAIVAPATINNGGNYQPLGMMVVANAPSTLSSYSWTLGYLSAAATDATFADATSQLQGATTKNPTLVPAETGVYKLTQGTDASLYFRVSTYHGAPSESSTAVDGVACASCHSGEYALTDKFTEWSNSAHGNFNWEDPSKAKMSLFQFGVDGGEGPHYSESCISCHVVGYSKVPTAANKGFDDRAKADGWTFPTVPATLTEPGNFAAMPADLQALGGIQCENCHGPLEPSEHSQPEGNPALFALPVSPVASMDAGVCLYCHDALSNHDKGPLWAASGHANIELAMEEGTWTATSTSTSCIRCHSAEGFMMYLPLQQAGAPGNPTLTDAQKATLSADKVHSQTCQTCHDPHSTELRVSGDTKQVAGMFQVQNAGEGALCIVCHNSRSGAVREGNATALTSTNLGRLGLHAACQGDMFAGRNAYFMPGMDGTEAASALPYKSAHSFLADTCVDCHVKWVPADLKSQFNPAGTNHTFRSSPEICIECHGEDIGSRIQDSVGAKMVTLQGAVTRVLSAKLLAAGFDTKAKARKDPTNTSVTLPDPADPTVLPADIRSIQALSTASAVVVTLNDGTSFYIGLDGIYAANTTTSIFTIAASNNTQTLLRAYSNLLFVNNDGTKGIHNPAFAGAALDNATAALSGLVIE